MNLRKLAGSLKRLALSRGRAGTLLERSLYYGLVSDAYRRERSLISAGHRQFANLTKGRNQEFLLRRNIHMLEKGLTMRPRRHTFALDYIDETVSLFGDFIEVDRDHYSHEVASWAHYVLVLYFEATEASDSNVIAKCRIRFRELMANCDYDFLEYGPHAPGHVNGAKADFESVMNLAMQRKSVRWFLEGQVSRDMVDRAMLVAREAPTACNRQPFTFRIFDDPDMVRQVVDVPMGTSGYGHNIPSVAVIVGDTSAFSDERDRHLIYTDGCLAAMSFIFGLESQGVASVCINWPDIASRDARMKRLLGLSPHERVVMLVGFGYADPEGLTPYSAKRPLELLRKYNQL